MPGMPKWLADFSEKTFKAAYKQTVITEVEYYAPKLKRIRYQGDALKSIEWKPAQEVEFRVGTKKKNIQMSCFTSMAKAPEAPGHQN